MKIILMKKKTQHMKTSKQRTVVNLLKHRTQNIYFNTLSILCFKKPQASSAKNISKPTAIYSTLEPTLPSHQDSTTFHTETKFARLPRFLYIPHKN